MQSAKQGLLLTGFLEWASPRVQRIMIFRRVFFSLSAPPWLYQMEQCLSSFGCPGITGARVVWSLARQATEMSRYPVAEEIMPGRADFLAERRDALISAISMP